MLHYLCTIKNLLNLEAKRDKYSHFDLGKHYVISEIVYFTLIYYKMSKIKQFIFPVFLIY